jgi:hypothetical protein
VDEILIWAIPPLSPPQQSDFPHFPDNNSTHIPPLFKIPFPDDVVRHSHEILGRMTLSSWYFGSGSLESVYFDFFYTSKLQRFKIIIKPDLSDASLHVISISEFISDGSITSTRRHIARDYKICEDSFVYLRNNLNSTSTEHAASILTSAPSSNVVMQWDGHVDSLCPTSGRSVYWAHWGRRIVVVDLF